MTELFKKLKGKVFLTHYVQIMYDMNRLVLPIDPVENVTDET